MAEAEYGKLMDKNYKPHIVGTNHLLYNLDATIPHIQSLGEIKPVMLEAYDPNDDSPPLAIDLAKVGGDIEIIGIKSSPNVFYGEYINKNIPNSSYVFVDDKEKIELYGRSSFEAIFDALKRIQQ